MVYFYGAPTKHIPSWAANDKFLENMIEDILSGNESSYFPSGAETKYSLESIYNNGIIYNVESRLYGMDDAYAARAKAQIIIVDDDVYFVVTNYGHSHDTPYWKCNDDIVYKIESKLGTKLDNKNLNNEAKKLMTQKYLMKGLSATKAEKANSSVQQLNNDNSNVYLYKSPIEGYTPKWTKDVKYIENFIVDILAGKREGEVADDSIDYYQPRLYENGIMFEVSSHIDGVVDQYKKKARAKIIIFDDAVHLVITDYGHYDSSLPCNSQQAEALTSMLGAKVTVDSSKTNEKKEHLLIQNYLMKGLSILQGNKLDKEDTPEEGQNGKRR